jgi:hypothetical protein
VEDPNTTHDVLDKFNMFKTIVVCELDFVKIMRMSKILNNKDCNLSTKLLCCESFTYVCQIWLSYDRLTPDVDGILCHNKNYKVNSFLSLYGI